MAPPKTNPGKWRGPGAFSRLAPAATTPTGRRPDRAWQIDNDNPLRRAGLFFGLLFIFVRFSLLNEILTFSFGFNTYILIILAVPAILAVLLSGGLRRSFQQRPTFYWVGFALWLAVAAPFSSWRGDSLHLVLSFFRTEVPILFVMAGLAMSWRECKWIMYTIALAGIVNELVGKYFSRADEGRLQLDFGMIGNPNDFSAHLLLVLPFLLFVFLQPGVPRKLVMAAPMLYSLYLIAATSSRGALIALAAAIVFIFLKASPSQRIAFALLVPCIVALGIAKLPTKVLNRYATLAEDDSQTLNDEAVGSKYTRMYLLKTSIRYTLLHPLFGVGPGQFASNEGQGALAKGHRGAWQVSHNSYTQASSEAGIPALFFVIAGILSTYRILNNTYRQARAHPAFKAIANAAFCLMLSLVAFSVVIFFLSMIYRFYLLALSGLAVAFVSAAQVEFAAWRPAPAARVFSRR